MFICAICGRFFRTQYPCSYMLSVGDSFCCLRFILPQIPQISQILYIPVSVLICAICGKLLRPRYPCSSAISVGAILCILRLFSHRFHRYSQILYIPISVLICAIRGKHLRTQYLCSSVLSVGDFLCCLRFILPRIPQIFTDFIYPIIRAPLCYLWEIPSHDDEKLLFLHRQRDAASALIHFRHSHHHVLVQLHHVIRVLHVAVGEL